MKTILITGGCGFIGSHLCKYLINNAKVICLDNLLTGSKENINSLLSNSSFQYIEHDIIHPFFIEDSIDEIYHLACPASPPKYQKDPILTMKINFIGTLNMLELAKTKNAKILLTSTSEIYGEPEVSPQKETYRGNVNSIGIRSCYDEGKRLAETLMMEYHRKQNVDIAIARIFNTYGPFMDAFDGRVISNFIRQAISGEMITIYGNGNQTRSFCYIDDQVEGLIKLMASQYVYPVNIGNTKSFSIQEIAMKIIEKTGTKSKIINLKLPDDDPTNRKPDITLANSILHWSPKVELDEGLDRTIQYFKNR